jgi:hypothetical protein
MVKSIAMNAAEFWGHAKSPREEVSEVNNNPVIAGGGVVVENYLVRA